jgi:hypothetical protein
MLDDDDKSNLLQQAEPDDQNEMDEVPTRNRLVANAGQETVGIPVDWEASQAQAAEQGTRLESNDYDLSQNDVIFSSEAGLSKKMAISIRILCLVGGEIL